MKTIALMAAGLFFLCNSAVSQDSVSIVTLPEVTITSIARVNDAVDKAFRKGFPDARQLRWYKLNKDYLAKFIKDDMKHQALFQKNGYIKYDISYGGLQDLPVSINEQLETVYNGYKVTRVAKVVRYDQEFWIVNLEGINDFLVVRAENGDLEEVKRMEKNDEE